MPPVDIEEKTRLRRKFRTTLQHQANRLIYQVSYFHDKSVFSFLHQLTTWHFPHLLLRVVCGEAAAAERCMSSNRSISPVHRAHNSNPQQRSATGEWEKQTDRQTDGHRTVTYTLFRILCGQCE